MEGDYLIDLGIDINILKLILKVTESDVDCTHRVYEMEHWRALVNTVMDLEIPQKSIIYSFAKRLLASEERLCSVELF